MSLIYRTNVKRLALELSARNRNGKFTRVGASFLDRVESRLRQMVHDEVHRHPSVGKTLK